MGYEKIGFRDKFYTQFKGHSLEGIILTGYSIIRTILCFSSLHFFPFHSFTSLLKTRGGHEEKKLNGETQMALDLAGAC